MTEGQRDDLTWLATVLRRRARQCDRLTYAEMCELADMLDNIRQNRGACAPVVIPFRRRLTMLEGGRQ